MQFITQRSLWMIHSREAHLSVLFIVPRPSLCTTSLKTLPCSLLKSKQIDHSHPFRGYKIDSLCKATHIKMKVRVHISCNNNNSKSSNRSLRLKRVEKPKKLNERRNQFSKDNNNMKQSRSMRKVEHTKWTEFLCMCVCERPRH